MGVDCRVTIPAGARLTDVADVIGLALGCTHTWNEQGWIEVAGVAVSACGKGLESCAYIDIDPPAGDRRHLMYHFEWSGAGERGIIMRSFSANLALAKKIVDTFGGFIDYSDSDDSACDYGRPAFEHNHAEDGAAWRSLQQRKKTVTPITPADIDAMKPFAAYDNR